MKKLQIKRIIFIKKQAKKCHMTFLGGIIFGMIFFLFYTERKNKYSNLKKVILYGSVKTIFCGLRLTNAYDWFEVVESGRKLTGTALI
jgi:hypothetical protein